LPPPSALEQLEKVLSSEVFRGTGRSNRLLRFLVEQTVNGQADRLKEYTLGAEALGRGDSFRPTDRFHCPGGSLPAAEPAGTVLRDRRQRRSRHYCPPQRQLRPGLRESARLSEGPVELPPNSLVCTGWRDRGVRLCGCALGAMASEAAKGPVSGAVGSGTQVRRPVGFRSGRRRGDLARWNPAGVCRIRLRRHFSSLYAASESTRSFRVAGDRRIARSFLFTRWPMGGVLGWRQNEEDTDCRGIPDRPVRRKRPFGWELGR
jgi:hypothetical protein